MKTKTINFLMSDIESMLGSIVLDILKHVWEYSSSMFESIILIIFKNGILVISLRLFLP